MDVIVTICYSTDDEDVNASVSSLLDNTLPYMADNVDVVWNIIGEDN
jgi:hypothetical protein